MESKGYVARREPSEHAGGKWIYRYLRAGWRRLSVSFDGGFTSMMTTLKLASLLAVIAVVIPSVAHALELPGKLRLSREQYLAVQPIYYPGFTIAGTAEPLSILILGALLAVTPRGTPTFVLIACAVLAVAITHALYWTLTAPVNKFWLREEGLSGGAQRLFDAGGSLNESDWTRLRDRWETVSFAARRDFADRPSRRASVMSQKLSSLKSGPS